MSHIQWELNAIEKAPYVARAAECDEDVVFGGLTRLWVYCWREKTATVTDAALRGIFRANVTEGLLAFGFLERLEPGIYRVKGAARYLRVQDGWSKGGHAAKGNLIPGGKKKGSKALKSPNAGSFVGSSSAFAETGPEIVGSRAEKEPKNIVGSPSAPPRPGLGLTPNIDHRSSIIDTVVPETGSEDPDGFDDEPELPSIPSPKAEDLQALWNHAAPLKLPRWKKSEGVRLERARKAVKAMPLRGRGDTWEAVIRRIGRSKFLCGGGPRGWKASPDFLLQPGVATKILEGQYDDGAPIHDDPSTRPRWDPEDDPGEAPLLNSYDAPNF